VKTLSRTKKGNLKAKASFWFRSRRKRTQDVNLIFFYIGKEK